MRSHTLELFEHRTPTYHCTVVCFQGLQIRPGGRRRSHSNHADATWIVRAAHSNFVGFQSSGKPEDPCAALQAAVEAFNGVAEQLEDEADTALLAALVAAAEVLAAASTPVRLRDMARCHSYAALQILAGGGLSSFRDSLKPYAKPLFYLFIYIYRGKGSIITENHSRKNVCFFVFKNT